MKTNSNSHSRTAHAHDPLESLKDDFTALRRDITALISERASGHLGQASETINGVVRMTSKQAGVMHKQLSKTAGERPLTTILVAAVAGAVGAKALWWLVRR